VQLRSISEGIDPAHIKWPSDVGHATLAEYERELNGKRIDAGIAGETERNPLRPATAGPSADRGQARDRYRCAGEGTHH
jgi:hypothetical protein